ncbi:MAG: hypothetical protein AB8B51_11020 [Sedimentitalea sp.]
MSWLDTLGGVLFVGHSLFGQTNPQMLDDVLPPEVVVEAQIINGAPLSYNWENGDAAEGANARKALAEGRFDVLIVTEAIPLANHLQWSDSAGALKNYADLAHGANPQARVFLQETWHSLNSGTGVDVPYDANSATPWRTRLDQDADKWQSLLDNANAQHSTPPVQMIPAGQAMARLHDAITAGTVPGLNSIGDVFADDIHPNHIGFYFLTMLQYAVIADDSPIGLPAQLADAWGKPYPAIAPDLAQTLQTIAWETLGGQVEVAAKRTPPSILELARPDPVATRSSVAIGLAAVTDWSPQQPFLDVMKTARAWIGHRPGQWGGMEFEDMRAQGLLDPNGYPLQIPRSLGSIGTLVLTDLPPQARLLAGRYRLQFEGNGIVEAGGRAKNVRYGRNHVTFDFVPGPGSVDIRIQKTDRARNGDHVRNITLVREDRAAALDNGELFNPDWLARLDGFSALRFMDWMETNNSEQSQWDNRPRMADFTWAGHGVPLPIMIALANRLQADAWFNMPHLATDGYVTRFAQQVHSALGPDQTAFVEFSNEVWNWQFQQTRWADEKAQALWSARDAGMQFYGKRAAEIAQIWSGVFGAGSPRLRNVISSQTGWLGLEEAALEAPLWQQDRPARHFDAYAITGYFGGILGLEDRAPMVRDWIDESLTRARTSGQEQGLTGQDLETHIARYKWDFANAMAGQELQNGALSGEVRDTLDDLLGTTWPYHADVAQRYGLDLIMYEGGSHVVGLGAMVDDNALTAFFVQFNYAPDMGVLYARLLEGWHRLGGQMFTAYSDVYAPNKWGSWGALRYLSDTNPRWNALVAAQ